MRNIWRVSFLLIAALLVGFLYGAGSVRFQLFPYKVLKSTSKAVKELFHKDGSFSIGIYKGSSPFDLGPIENIPNPILEAKDITDIDASFVADPFMIIKDTLYYMYFEAFNTNTNQGDIGLAISKDCKDWDYRGIVIDEEFHLSYPYAFEWNNSYYMIPETNQDYTVRLYMAVEFPSKWEHVSTLLSGYRYLDPSIFRYEGKWWMFVGAGNNGVLNLYYSSDLFSGWMPHSKNPIVKFDSHKARPAGRIINYNEKIYRLAQDDYPRYGMQVFAFEITELTDTTYAEVLVPNNPVKMSGYGWNASGMHHIDAHKINEYWISVVDGY